MGTDSATLNLPDDLFEEAGDPTETSPLEKFLKRERDNMGNLVPKRRAKRSIAAAVYSRTEFETQAMIDERNFDGCQIRHLVALYAIMHKKCYGVEVVMSSTERYTATARMGRFARTMFGGDLDKVIDYLRWLWTREMSREKWRRENNHGGGTISFFATISGALVTQYRVFLSRQHT